MSERRYQIETEDGEVLATDLTMEQAEFQLCLEINRGAEDAYIVEQDDDNQ